MTDPAQASPPLPPTDPQSLVDARTIEIVLAPVPGAVGLQLTTWPDVRAAPQSHAVITTIAYAIVWLQTFAQQIAQRVAALEVLTAESARPVATGNETERTRDESRHGLALAAVCTAADAVAIASTPGPVPASALDSIKLH